MNRRMKEIHHTDASENRFLMTRARDFGTDQTAEISEASLGRDEPKDPAGARKDIWRCVKTKEETVL